MRPIRKKTIMLTSVFIMSIVSSVKAVDYTSPFLPLTKTILPNGMTVIVKESHTNPIATVNVWVATGAVNESEDSLGISHLIEHMIFKPTVKFPMGMMNAVQSMGGDMNGMTSLDTTNYYITVPSESIWKAVELEADAICNPVFDQKELDKERQVVLEELRQGEDNPYSSASLRLYQEVFAGTPYTKNVIGDSKTLANCTPTKISDYYKKWYVPNNMTVVITGDVTTSQALAAVEKQFGQMKPAPVDSRPFLQLPINPASNIELFRDVQTAYVLAGLAGPGDSSEDALTLSVTGVLLGGGMSSRLFSSLVMEQALALSVNSSYESYAGIGMFTISATLVPQAVEAYKAQLHKELTRLSTELVTPEELQRAKTIVESSFAYASETTTNIASVLGSCEAYFDVELATDYNHRLKAITQADIMRIAKEYLDPSRLIFTVVNPKGGK